jgi:DNA-binding MarR family transcriptional regulator
MPKTKRETIERLYEVLQSYERLYQFRDPNNACLFDLRVNECYALELIVERGPLSVVEIAQFLGIHKSNASRIARSLEAKEFVKETQDRKDGRRILWSATAKGRAKHNAVRSYLVDRFEKTLKGFKVDELAGVVAAISRLTIDAEERMSEQCLGLG